MYDTRRKCGEATNDANNSFPVTYQTCSGVLNISLFLIKNFDSISHSIKLPLYIRECFISKLSF